MLPSDGRPKAKANAKAKAGAKAKAKGKAMKKKKKQTGTVNMTINRYVVLVESRFKTCREICFRDNKPVHLVQDHEKCFWNEHSLAALKEAGFSVLENFPVSSPDLSAIDGWWHRIKKRLEETAPERMEPRSEFLVRLRRIVHWLNESAADDVLHVAQNPKTACQGSQRPEGCKVRLLRHYQMSVQEACKTGLLRRNCCV